MLDQKQRTRRVVAILLALVAAAGLGVAAFGNRWLSTTDYEGGIGLRGFEICHGPCVGDTNFELVRMVEVEILRVKEANTHLEARQQHAVPRDPWHGFPVMGLLAFGGSLLAAAGLLVGAVLAILRKRVAWPIMPTTLVVLGLFVALITGCLFVATKPELVELMGVGWSFMAFGGGLVMGLAAVFPLNRQIRWFDPELGAASATMSWGGSRDDQ